MTTARKSMRWTLWLPLCLFGAFLALVAYGLARPSDREIASEMVGKPVPQFDLPPAVADLPGLSSEVYQQGHPRLINVFASWCIPCAVEAPQLEQLRKAGIAIDGIAIRDRADDVTAFLDRNGNPFDRIGADKVSKVQFALGSSGVPETFVVDGEGVIRYQHIGVVMERDVPVLLRELREAGL